MKPKYKPYHVSPPCRWVTFIRKDVSEGLRAVADFLESTKQNESGNIATIEVDYNDESGKYHVGCVSFHKEEEATP